MYISTLIIGFLIIRARIEFLSAYSLSLKRDLVQIFQLLINTKFFRIPGFIYKHSVLLKKSF